MPEIEGQGGNPDAAQDEELIKSVIMELVGPFAEEVMAKLKELDEKVDRIDDLVMKFTDGLIGAADNHKRTSLSEHLSTNYGKDLEPLEGFHKDVYGKGLSDSLLEEMMGENGPDDEGRDEWIKGKLGEAKGRFGKYLGIKAEGEPAIEVKEEGEIPGKEALAGEEEDRAGEAEEKKGIENEKEGNEREGALEEKKGEAEEEAGEGEEEDAISKLMKEVTSMGGARHRLSEPLSRKKSKAPVRR